MAHRSVPSSSPAVDRDLGSVDGLAQLSFLVYGTLERLASAHELSVIQTRLLGVLRDRTPNMNELATLLSLDKSSVTGLIDRAERRGLVQRTPSDTDRRAMHVSLTAKGRRLVAAVASRFEAEVGAMLESLKAAERQRLSALVSRVLVAQAAQQGIELFPATGARSHSRGEHAGQA
jgi:DNA-binding MarR family transcriptional regulator